MTDYTTRLPLSQTPTVRLSDVRRSRTTSPFRLTSCATIDAIQSLKRSMFLLCLLLTLYTIPASAACSSNGTEPGTGIPRWLCTDTGNPTTNGDDLNAFLYTDHPYACGDIIEFAPTWVGKTPDGYGGGGYWGSATPQTNCNGKLTTLRSTHVSSIPLNAKQKLVNYRQYMPTFVIAGSTGAMYLARGANNWAYRGLRVTTSAYPAEHRMSIGSFMFAPTFQSANLAEWIADKFHNFEVDRCLFEEYQDLEYGDPNIDNYDYRTYIRAVVTTFDGNFDKLYVHDSYVKTAGYTRTSGSGGSDWIDITTVTKAAQAVIQNGTSDLTTILGITYSAGCEDNGVTGCEGHAARIIMRGATGDWVDLNTPHYVRARADGDLDLLARDVDFDHLGTVYNSSGKPGTFTSSSPQIAVIGLLTQYGFNFNGGNDLRFIDNYIETWGMPAWLGGADGFPIDPADVVSGTYNSITASHVRGVKVGDVLTYNIVNVGAPSAYCGSGNCLLSANFIIRNAKVTAISGTTLTLMGWGPNGATAADTPNTTTGKIWWQSTNINGFELRGSYVTRGYRHANADAGKGSMELKGCLGRCIFDGIVWNGYLDDNNVPIGSANWGPFTESVSQGNTAPHQTDQIILSNSLESTTYPSGAASCPWRYGFNGQSGENVTDGQANSVVEHALRIGCTAESYAYNNATSSLDVSGSRNNRFEHVSYAPVMGEFFNTFYMPGTCLGPYPYHEVFQRVTDTAVKNNIFGFVQMTLPDVSSCWPTITSDVTHNVFIDILSAGSSAVASALTANNITSMTNTIVDDYTGFWAGTCAYDSWLNCSLHPSNPARGTASDGGDPGADVLQVQDRIHRWSERAGLLNFQRSWILPNSANVKMGSTTASFAIRLFGSTPGTCTFQVFTTRNRSTAHADTSSPVACNRSDPTATTGRVIFVAGTASALTANTTYFYKIIDGNRIMVGEFTTRPAGSAACSSIVQGASASLTYSLNADLSSGTTLGAATIHTVPAAAGTLVYYARTTGERGTLTCP